MAKQVVLMTVIKDVNDLTSGTTQVLGIVNKGKHLELFLEMGAQKELHKIETNEELAALVGRPWAFRLFFTPTVDLKNCYYAEGVEDDSIAIFSAISIADQYRSEDGKIKFGMAEDNIVADYRDFDKLHNEYEVSEDDDDFDPYELQFGDDETDDYDDEDFDEANCDGDCENCPIFKKEHYGD